MFDHAIFLRDGTSYDELLITPDVTADEIREAKSEAVMALDEVRAGFDAALKALEVAVPGLAAALHTLRVAQANTKIAPHELAAAKKNFAELEARALAVNPGYREILCKTEKVERRKIEINQITIDNPEARSEYDRENPPFALLKLDDATRDGFVDNKTAVGLLRRELTRFFQEHGEDVFQPNDFCRDDFSTEYTPNALID